KRRRKECRRLRRLAPYGCGHLYHTSVGTPERRAALISWGLPRQQGRLHTKHKGLGNIFGRLRDRASGAQKQPVEPFRRWSRPSGEAARKRAVSSFTPFPQRRGAPARTAVASALPEDD